ncbi:MAG: methionine adenosyltransferase [Candidatus Omnitrophica bacterium]|nr:methionine adenosyltransferase [Candidatus Omnitrophota bacterium]
MKCYFTSESVGHGHPDKVSDAISDAVLDKMLEQDPKSRVACETMCAKGTIVVSGEVTTQAYVDVQRVVADTLTRIGYNADNFGVLTSIHTQSPDIAQGVDTGGAGDQGLMFGYACKQTEELMPLPISLAHKLVKTLDEYGRGTEYLRPDTKSQVTIEYEGKEPKRIEAVVVAASHDSTVTMDQLRKDIRKNVIDKVIPEKMIDSDTKFHINATGRFEEHGPAADVGLTGRKIIVDTYGGWSRHGGGAFSGKDSTKVDRSAAYMARYIAKNIVAADLADEVEIQLAYCIGVAEPVSVMVDSFGTGKIDDKKLSEAVREVFPLCPQKIIEHLELRKPVFAKTSAYGHFGNPNFRWEKVDKVEELKKAVK